MLDFLPVQLYWSLAVQISFTGRIGAGDVVSNGVALLQLMFNYGVIFGHIAFDIHVSQVIGIITFAAVQGKIYLPVNHQRANNKGDCKGKLYHHQYLARRYQGPG